MFIYVIYFERKTSSMGRAERENPKQALRCSIEPDVGLNPTTREIMTRAKI